MLNFYIKNVGIHKITLNTVKAQVFLKVQHRLIQEIR